MASLKVPIASALLVLEGVTAPRWPVAAQCFRVPTARPPQLPEISPLRDVHAKMGGQELGVMFARPILHVRAVMPP